MKIFSTDPRVGFLAHADKFASAAASGKVLPPRQDHGRHGPDRLQRPDRRGTVRDLPGRVLAILVYAVRTCLIARRIDRPSVTEVPPELVAAE